MLETQTGFKLKWFRTDGGRENDNALFSEWLTFKGIVWKPMHRESPQQNLSERLNRTIWDPVRPMMVSTCLGPSFPPHAFPYGIHIRNLTPSAGRLVTPHFSLFSVNVDVTRLREFGCLAWVLIPPGMRKSEMLAMRGIRRVLVGLWLPLASYYTCWCWAGLWILGWLALCVRGFWMMKDAFVALSFHLGMASQYIVDFSRRGTADCGVFLICKLLISSL